MSLDPALSLWRKSPFNLLPNPDAEHDATYPAELQDIFSQADCEAAQTEIQGWPEYRTSNLVKLPGLARTLNLADISFKDESERFSLGSFKALGGAYAVLKLLQRLLHENFGFESSSEDLRRGQHKELIRNITVTTATDGNHGRSVAWGAQLFGCKAVIFVPRSCSKARIAAISELGADAIQTKLNYDDTVRYCADIAKTRNYHVISDTSWEGYRLVPGQVMHGYSVIAREIFIQYFKRPFREAVPPSHIFIQAGVGGMAAAITGYLWQLLGARRPRIIIVEPENAACLYASAAAGGPTRASGDKETGEVHTIMAGLDCGEVSPLAWEILVRGADAFMTIPDSVTGPTMKLLANPPFTDPPLVAGESSIAGLAALMMVASHEDCRDILHLTADSRVLLINSEGAMDQELYKTLLEQQRNNEDII
ncbi:diaminopropionate ammonia-lyase [Kiloniella laminariae]|uniref:Diaminopropionate ammonia-lyase n=1 Tax=Kiloniella laminariae TaxID=454162 RepID=A0ABT4LLA0_9PROT|nr:diaminopropionate ammonia-lyase [Kiloniella laminariae]MCZ4281884.1 diaminopropionate ammonia-lyase [Kiloniella laminariae]